MPASFVFTLTPDPSSSVSAPAAPAQPVVLGQASTAKKSGLIWPFRIGSNGNPVTGMGDDLRESRVAFVGATRASSHAGAGEIPMRMRLGSTMHLLLNTSFNDVREGLAVVYGQRALSNALPNEVVMAAEVETHENGEVNVTLYVADRRTVNRSTQTKVPIKIARKP